MSATRPTRIAAPISLASLAALLAALLAGCGPGDPVAQVRSLEDEGNFEEAVEPARALMEARGGDPEVAYLYGRALSRTGQNSLAQFPLRKAMESPDWLIPAGLELAGGELATDNADSAIEVTSRILETDPDHLEALLLRARARAESRRHYDEALGDIEHALEVDPGNFEASMLRVVSLLGLERVDDAEKGLVELESSARAAESPDDLANLCAMRGVLADEKDDAETAERIFGECVDAHPTEGVAIERAAKFFDAHGKPERTLEMLRKALAESAALGGVRRELATRLRTSGQTAEAERLLREGTELENPGAKLEAWVDLANHYHEVGDDAAAASALEHAVELPGASGDPQLQFDYADALVMAGRYDEALAIARSLGVPAQRALVEGRVALEQGRPAEALEHFTEGLRLWPDNAVARYHAALAAEALGDFDRAIAEYRYSIRAGADETDVRLRLARLHAAEGADDLAIQAAQHDAEEHPAGVETELVGVRAAARAGNRAALRGGLARLSGDPAARARAVAAAGEGVRERQGAAAAARLVEESEGLDLTDPQQADALRVLVACLGESGNAAAGLALAKEALAKHPDAAAFHAIQAQALAASGAPAGSVRAAYARALELDAKQVEALRGLARLAADAKDPSAALDFYARAAAADAEDAAALEASAQLLLALGRREEAEARLGEALARDPYDGQAARQLAELLLDRDAEVDRALVLARTAARFGGGPEAQALLTRAQERQARKAAPAAARADVGAP